MRSAEPNTISILSKGICGFE